MLAIYRTHLSRPAVEQYQIALAGALQNPAVAVNDGRLHAKKRHGGRTGLEVDRARQRADQYPAGFRLPPGVDDRTAAVAHDTVIPLHASGLIGSPTDPSSRRLWRDQAFTGASPSRMSERIAVGDEYKIVILCLSTISQNRPVSG